MSKIFLSNLFSFKEEGKGEKIHLFGERVCPFRQRDNVH